MRAKVHRGPHRVRLEEKDIPAIHPDGVIESLPRIR